MFHSRTVTHDWSDIAIGGTAIVSLGVDAFAGQMRDLDRYLMRRARVYLGRMHVEYGDG